MLSSGTNLLRILKINSFQSGVKEARYTPQKLYSNFYNISFGNLGEFPGADQKKMVDCHYPLGSSSSLFQADHYDMWIIRRHHEVVQVNYFVFIMIYI